MNKFKILFIGIDNIPDKKDDEILRRHRVKQINNGYILDEILSLHDYDIVFVNYSGSQAYLSTRSLTQWDYIIGRDDRKNLLDYIKGGESGGGIIVIFLGPCPFDNNKCYYHLKCCYYPWAREFIELSIDRGDRIESDPKHWLGNIFSKYKFTWYCLLRRSENLDMSIILSESFRKSGSKFPYIDFETVGTTISGRCISSIFHYNNGKIILLPIPKNMSSNLLRDILDKIKDNYFKKNDIPGALPLWVDEWNFAREVELRTERGNVAKNYNDIDKKIKYYESIKRILLTGSGLELSYIVSHIFENMGFKVDYKEEKGHQDIEIGYKSFFAIIEVTGTKGFANNDKIRQLLEYITIRKSITNVKGIFITNHYNKDDPHKRGMPYTDEALNLAKGFEFCLLTTVDLFNIYDSFLQKNITIDQIIDIFEKTKGLIIFEKR